MNEDKAARFHRLQRRAAWLSLGVQAAIMLTMVAGGALMLRNMAVSAFHTSPSSPVTVTVFTLLFLLVIEIAGFPQRFYRTFVLEHRYGLSAATLRVWLIDHFKGFGLGMLLALGAAQFVYLALGRWPVWWWAITAAVAVVVVVVLAGLTPIVLLPVFYRFKPLDRASLLARIDALSRRAGVPVLGVYEWSLGDKSRRANAALVGAGGNRRILLSDTLLEHYTDDEIEVILAHELGHHAHRDIRNGLAIEALVIALACGVAGIALQLLWRPLGLESPTDVAGLPLLVMTAATVSILATPLMNAWSRRNEHRADRFALELTDRPDAFVSAMRRLAAQNLAEPRPSTTTLWLFHSHPPFDERIQAARTFLS
jgi:STE24 endopeptidase